MMLTNKKFTLTSSKVGNLIKPEINVSIAGYMPAGKRLSVTTYNGWGLERPEELQLRSGSVADYFSILGRIKKYFDCELVRCQ